mmetsp:Transcript_24994/g.54500  ORF Transcript_24994/g.54500 Transcript_24994/m.54500 type:complete len:96 (-) Transcript_24994:458-745(-)
MVHRRGSYDRTCSSHARRALRRSGDRMASSTVVWSSRTYVTAVFLSFGPSGCERVDDNLFLVVPLDFDNSEDTAAAPGASAAAVSAAAAAANASS